MGSVDNRIDSPQGLLQITCICHIKLRIRSYEALALETSALGSLYDRRGVCVCVCVCVWGGGMFSSENRKDPQRGQNPESSIVGMAQICIPSKICNLSGLKLSYLYFWPRLFKERIILSTG